MAIFVRTDGDQSTGLGHLMRCLALAQEFAARHVDVFFFVRHASVNQCTTRHDWVGRVIEIPEAVPVEQESDWLFQNQYFAECSLLVLDGYQFTSEYRKKLQQLPVPLVLFDDNNDSGALYCDAVINGAFGAETLRYDTTAKEALLLCGENFRVLRQEFLLQTDIPMSQRNSITIMMGGADALGFTLGILEAIARLDADIPLRVIMGSAFVHKEALQELIHKIPNPVQCLENCQSVAEVLAHSRIAISAAGSTQFELHSCATPTIFFVTADNQRFSMKNMREAKWASCFDALNDGCEAGVELAVSLYHNDIELKEMHVDALNTRDNLGVVRVVDSLQQLI